MTELWLDMEKEQNILTSTPYVQIPGFTLELEFVPRCVLLFKDHPSEIQRLSQKSYK